MSLFNRRDERDDRIVELELKLKKLKERLNYFEGKNQDLKRENEGLADHINYLEDRIDDLELGAEILTETEDSLDDIQRAIDAFNRHQPAEARCYVEKAHKRLDAYIW
jgi:predicted nuclease with TOPRIM domain